MGESLPTRGLFLTEEFEEIYIDTVKQLISDFGRTVKLFFKPGFTECPNCFSGPDSKSNGKYDFSNPNPLNGALNKPFPNGGICPVCTGSHKIPIERSVSYTANIYTVSKDSEFLEEGINPQSVRRTKMVISAFEDLKKTEKALIDGELYVRLRDPIKRGFHSLNFVVCFWKKLT